MTEIHKSFDPKSINVFRAPPYEQVRVVTDAILPVLSQRSEWGSSSYFPADGNVPMPRFSQVGISQDWSSPSFVRNRNFLDEADKTSRREAPYIFESNLPDQSTVGRHFDTAMPNRNISALEKAACP